MRSCTVAPLYFLYFSANYFDKNDAQSAELKFKIERLGKDGT